MKVLVYIEARDPVLAAEGLAVLRRAALLGDADGFVCGPADEELLSLAAAQGARQVVVATGEGLEEALPQPHVEALSACCRADDYDAVFFSSSVLTADIAGALAARHEAGVNWDLRDVELHSGELVGIRLALSDSVLAEVGWTTSLRIASFRGGAFEPVAGPVSPAATVALEVDVPEGARTTSRRPVGEEQAASATRLVDASVIVAGGRGMGTRENLDLVRALAEALDGQPAVSMPLVSAGWAPYAMQVGQTGSVVRPKLYIACGISGQVQHKVGMERAETIVAINRDESAPIFRFCDLAVVADATDVLPKLTTMIREHAVPDR